MNVKVVRRASGRARRCEESGVVMVFVVIALVALMAMGAVVVDGSRAYSVRRQMQNAADGAAEGAARALDTARFQGGDPAQVDAIAQSIAAANGSSTASGLYSCSVIDKSGGTLAPCSDTSLVTGWRSPAILSQAVGVRVQSGSTYTTAFGKVAGHDTLTARTTAAATIQPVKTGEGPFMACGNPLKGAESPGGPGHELLVQDNTKNPPWAINPAAVGLTYDVHGPQVSDCGAQGDAFKGLADGPFTLPEWVDTQTGVHAGPTRSIVASANGCTTVWDSCTMIIPLCTDARGTNLSDLQMFCVILGVFTIHQTSANTHTATLLGGATSAIGGQTSNNDVTGQDFRIVKLIS